LAPPPRTSAFVFVEAVPERLFVRWARVAWYIALLFTSAPNHSSGSGTFPDADPAIVYRAASAITPPAC
jgi:hypothetical protein